MDESTFQSTLADAATGDRPALGALYSRFNPTLVRFLKAQAPVAGEDLAQDTWLSVAATLRSFSGDERAFRMLLLTEARQQLSLFKKGQGREPVRPVEPRLLRDVRSTSFSDATVADAALAELLEGLRPLHVEILLLRVVGGLSAEETGALLGKSPGMIRVTQHRVLRQMARRLGPDRVRK